MKASAASRSHAYLYRIGLTLGVIGLPILYYAITLTQLRKRLEKEVEFKTGHGELEKLQNFATWSIVIPQRRVSDKDEPLETIKEKPTSRSRVSKQRLQSFGIVDQAVKTVKLSLLPDWEPDKLLTAYLRHNFTRFIYLPQSYIMWFMCDAEARKTWDESYVSTLNFEMNDVVCGTYRIGSRSPNKAEFDLQLKDAGENDNLGGTLVIRIDTDSTEDRATFSTELFMWRLDDKAHLPLESRVAKWAHELTSMWLLDVGVRHMTTLRQWEA